MAARRRRAMEVPAVPTSGATIHEIHVNNIESMDLENQNYVGQPPSASAHQPVNKTGGLRKSQVDLYCPECVQPETLSEPDICSVCLEPIYPGAIKRVLACTHQYHSSCIARWVVKQARCPLCNLAVDHVPILQTLSPGEPVHHSGEIPGQGTLPPPPQGLPPNMYYPPEAQSAPGPAAYYGMPGYSNGMYYPPPPPSTTFIGTTPAAVPADSIPPHPGGASGPMPYSQPSNVYYPPSALGGMADGYPGPSGSFPPPQSMSNASVPPAYPGSYPLVQPPAAWTPQVYPQQAAVSRTTDSYDSLMRTPSGNYPNHVTQNPPIVWQPSAPALVPGVPVTAGNPSTNRP
eukprot:CAMPEP_0184701228 /NCGR_PEP_ID=MMETSP0313-20130426/18759_1 /TAXON_ID=2792 /ORGANISM="Porphyridium aerugineum, Strain SAG 1380-2" /LENGTH=345 /DNA_ID=CAMNT_0027161213 /DNA_START=308 /DNA_END=1345 /DNA_ORIENTATION=-